MKVQTKVKMLKVKIKSLAYEAQVIRLEEHRAKGRRVGPGEFKGRDDRLRLQLREHRIKDVRGEQRHSLLAYAFLRGRSYLSCEGGKPRQWWQEPDWTRVATLVRVFGPVNPSATKEETVAALKAWRAGAVAAK